MTAVVFAVNTLAWTSLMLGYLWFAWEMSYEPAIVWEVEQ